MRSKRVITGVIVAGLLTTAPQAAWAERKENTLLGAGLGALGGALFSGGDPWAVVGGALAGGVVGNVASKDKHDRDRWDRRDREDRRDRWRGDRNRHDRQRDRDRRRDRY